MLRRDATVFVAVATSLPDILLVAINGWERVGECCARGSEVCKEILSSFKSCILVALLVTTVWSVWPDACRDSTPGVMSILTKIGGRGCTAKLSVLVICFIVTETETNSGGLRSAW